MNRQRKIVQKFCAFCRKPYETDHFESKFCSRTCAGNARIVKKEKECENCGTLFAARKAEYESPDGFRRYCSVKCTSEAATKTAERNCRNCGLSFRPRAYLVSCGQGFFCCEKCKFEYEVGDKAPAYKGGKYVASNSGDHLVLLHRPGYVGNYILENRLVASKAIGRLVTRSEVVIRINRNPDDNRAENLFVCASRSEHMDRVHGRLPWPQKSNLETYGRELIVDRLQKT